MQPEITPEVQALATDAKNLLSVAKAYTIDNNTTLQLAAEDLKSIKAKAKDLDTLRKTMTRPLDAAKKAVMDFFREPETFLAEAERTIKRAMLTFQQAEEDKRREEERKAREAAKREEDRLRKEAEERALAEMEAGNDAAAAEILEAPAPTVLAPVIPRSYEKPEGVSTRDNWKGECTDLMALVKAIAAGKAPITLVTPDTKVIGQMARSLKGSISYDGIRFYNEPTIAARAV